MGGNTLIYHFQISLGRAWLVIIKTGASHMLLTGEPPWFTLAHDSTNPSGIRNDVVLRYKEKKKNRKTLKPTILIEVFQVSITIMTNLGLFLSQKQYAIELLVRAHMTNCNPSRTPTIPRSSAEAEYRGVANVIAETAWLRNLLRELHSLLSAATLVYCDNVSATYLSANPVQHQLTKHIEIDIHFVRDLVTAGQVRALRVPSHYQYADIFTK
nr:ribonuclease H-like domain-containing protein [Tanacetum cinerariifolium]